MKSHLLCRLLLVLFLAKQEKYIYSRKNKNRPRVGSGLVGMDQPATTSALTTPLVSARFWISSSRDMDISMVSAVMVTRAAPLVGMVELMVRMLTFSLAKVCRMPVK